jgi:hypothetical protein
MNNKIKTKLTISRPSHSDPDKKCIRIEVKDVASKSRFLEIEIGLEEFAAALTGLSEQECEAVVSNLNNVGKLKESISYTVPVPSSLAYNRKAIAEYLNNFVYPDGWTADTYIGSQSSIVPNTDGYTKEVYSHVANIRLVRYVDVVGDSDE